MIKKAIANAPGGDGAGHHVSEHFSALYDYEIQTAELRYRTGAGY